MNTDVRQLLQEHPELWKANQLGQQRHASVHTGFPELDRELPGQGWPGSTLIELLLNKPGVGELRFLMPVMQKLAWEGRKIILLCPPHQPFAPAFEQHGLPLSALMVIQAHQPADKLWAVEQVMQSDGFGMSIAWLPEDRIPARTDQIRRLHLAASRSQGLSFVVRGSRAQHSASPAPLRLFLSAAGPQHLRLELLKRRGPVMDAPLFLQLPQGHAWLPRSYQQSLASTHPGFSHPFANKADQDAMDRFVPSAIANRQSSVTGYTTQHN